MLLDQLPAEIQLQIYEDVLVHAAPVAMSKPIAAEAFKYTRPAVVGRNDLSLLGLTPEIREMALPIFWGKNTFYFDTDENIREAEKCRCVDLQPPSTLRLLKRVVADVEVLDASWQYILRRPIWDWCPLLLRRSLDVATHLSVETNFWRGQTRRVGSHFLTDILNEIEEFNTDVALRTGTEELERAKARWDVTSGAKDCLTVSLRFLNVERKPVDPQWAAVGVAGPIEEEPDRDKEAEGSGARDGPGWDNAVVQQPSSDSESGEPSATRAGEWLYLQWLATQ